MKRIGVFQLVMAGTGTLLGLFGDVLANFIAGSDYWILQLFIALVIISAVVWGVLYLFRPRYTIASIKPVLTLDEQEQNPYARRGLIVFAPLFNPFKSPTAKALDKQQRLEAAEKEDYVTLDVEKSNFEPLIVAITAHASQLKHCWIVATLPGKNQDGSLAFVGTLVKYLQEQKELKCIFHYGQPYAVPIDNEDQITIKTRDLINRIFNEAKKEYKLSDKDIISDITSGFRSMPLGMILACLDRTRDLEFVGAHYDEDQPIEILRPMIINFDTQIFEGKEA